MSKKNLEPIEKNAIVELDEPKITVFISLEEAKSMLELYDSVESADAHYQTCQSSAFRGFVVATKRSKKVTEAYENLAQQCAKAEASLQNN
jgi:4-hydroxy-3-methylbut-2-en-1-yl diphosphate synthase IspG/GcpE